MTVDEKLWHSRKSEGADISTIEELVGADLALAYEIKDRREKIGRVELGLVRLPIFWEWIDPITGKDTSQINYYISRLNTLIDTRNRVDAHHEKLVRQAIPDFHIIRGDDVLMSRTAAIKQRERYDELMWRIRSVSIDDDFVMELIPDFEDRLNRTYEAGENRNWATDQQKIIGMLRDTSQLWELYINPIINHLRPHFCPIFPHFPAIMKSPRTHKTTIERPHHHLTKTRLFSPVYV